MHKRRIPLVIGLTLSLVTITGVGVRGVPILPRKHDLPDQVRSLAHLAKMRMDITPLSKLLKDHQVKISRLEKIVHEGLAEAGVKIDPDPKLPRLNLTVMASSDPEIPGAVGVTVLIMVSQHATVHRLDKTFADIPTATIIEHAMAGPDNVDAVVERHVQVTMWVLNTLIQKASRQDPEVEPPS